MTPDKYQAQSLTTWYRPSDPLHLELKHPLMGLAGETGELINQYKKHLYKPNYQQTREQFLDELGDVWYYLRIVIYQCSQSTEWWLNWANKRIVPNADAEMILADMNAIASTLLQDYCHNRRIAYGMVCQRVVQILPFLLARLAQLGSDIDELTELNYQKLNDKGMHGWKEAALGTEDGN